MLVKRVSRLKVAFKISLWTHSLGSKRRPCEYTDPRLYTSSFKSLSSFTLRVEVGRINMDPSTMKWSCRLLMTLRLSDSQTLRFLEFVLKEPKLNV